MARIDCELRVPRDIPDAELDGEEPAIRERCTAGAARTVVYLLISVFRRLAGGALVREVAATADSMGGIDMTLHLEWNSYFLRMTYAHSLNDSWQRLEIRHFRRGAALPAGVALGWDLELTGEGVLKVSLAGADRPVADEIRGLLKKCFRSVSKIPERSAPSPTGAYPSGEEAAGSDDGGESESEAMTPALVRLIAVFDTERDPYM
ncbi:MAG: hypothetical protein E4G96_10395, partial [Chrysiogenales bacterium]